MKHYIRDFVRVTLAVFIAFALLTTKDTLDLSPAIRHAAAYKYSVVQWEVGNFFAKWLHSAEGILAGRGLEEHEKRELVARYFLLGEEERRLEGMISEIGLPTDGEETTALEEYAVELAATREERAGIRDDVEERLEAALDEAIGREDLFPSGLFRDIGINFPPVDFRLEPSPRALIVSPRDRIETVEATLLVPGITEEEMDAIERRIHAEEDLSAIIVGTGGVATFPAVINARYSLRTTMRIAAHEWMHHYLFFRPLGQAYGRNTEMTTINETVASIFGDELGDLVSREFEAGANASIPLKPSLQPQAQQEPFDFREEMRETRFTTEDLLSEGRIEEAEAYMEERRLYMSENGYHIRKLNQAYFAFHGSYGDSPASISPIFEQLTKLRAASPTLGDFIRDVATVSSHEEFLELIEARLGDD